MRNPTIARCPHAAGVRQRRPHDEDQRQEDEEDQGVADREKRERAGVGQPDLAGGEPPDQKRRKIAGAAFISRARPRIPRVGAAADVDAGALKRRAYRSRPGRLLRWREHDRHVEVAERVVHVVEARRPSPPCARSPSLRRPTTDTRRRSAAALGQLRYDEGEQLAALTVDGLFTEDREPGRAGVLLVPLRGQDDGGAFLLFPAEIAGSLIQRVDPMMIASMPPTAR